MQKHFQTKVFSLVFGITFLLIPEFANARIVSLPRYTGEFAYRSNSGGRDKTCSSSYKYTCSGSGYAGGIGTSCNDLYTSCSCSTNYKWSGGSCVEKGCRDYNASYLTARDNTQSCVEVNPRNGLSCYECTPCDTNAYKYACTGDGYEQVQSGNACNNLYESCSCSSGYTWNGSECNKKCRTVWEYRKYRNCYCQLTYSDTYNVVCTVDTSYSHTEEIDYGGTRFWSSGTESLEECEGQLPSIEKKGDKNLIEVCD